MKSVVLIRNESTDEGTFGVLLVGGMTFFTGELPWRDNASNVSCIPPGEYTCSWTLSNRFKRMMYLVSPVEDRAGIRIHPANFMGDDSRGYRRQLNGCIALGEKLGWIEGQKALLVSAPAVRRFESILNCEPFNLEIRNV